MLRYGSLNYTSIGETAKLVFLNVILLRKGYKFVDMTIPRAEIAQLIPKFRSDFPHVAAGGHMMWPGSEPHQIMIDKIIFKFCIVVVIL